MPFKRFGYDQNFDGVLMDTNLLLLLLVGIFDTTLIEKFKRTQVFELDDYKSLLKIVSLCKNQLYTTPNILTELTNLTDNEILNKDGRFFIFLSDFINELKEVICESKTIIESNKLSFIKLGLADASIMNFGTQNLLIVTDDLKLYSFLSNELKPVINFNHIRFF